MTALRKPVGAPARFDPAAKNRKLMLAKVHIAKQQLGLVDDDYRAVLMRVAGRDSAGDCTIGELNDVLKEFEAKGFSAKARPKGPRPADHPGAMKARALWISLGQLGAVRDASEAALEAFAKRQLGIRMAWADQALVYKLIEALKAMAERAGWSQSVAGLNKPAVPTVLRRRLCEALMEQLWSTGLAPADWNIQRAAHEFAGIEIDLMFVTASTLERLASAFAAKLAAVRS